MTLAVLDAVSEEINNSIFRKGHTRLGFSSGLSGSGMAFEYTLFKNLIQGIDKVGEDKHMERKLLLQNIYIEYLEDVYTFDEKVRGKKEFYNQRRRWLATQFYNLFPVITGVPHAIASSMGMPKLSLSEVYRNAYAPLYRYARSLLGIYPG